MVGTHFEGFVSSHHQAGLLVLLVLEKSDIPSASLLPLSSIAIEPEELGSHLECLVFGFLEGLGLDFLGQMDDGLEVLVFALLHLESR